MNVITIPVGMIGTNCYILSSKEGGCAIIDPGAQPMKIADEIEQAGLTPRYILLTHCHYDHIGGVRQLMKLYPDIPLYIGKGDSEQITDPEKSMAVSRGMSAEDFIIKEHTTFEEGQELKLDELTIKVIETPGHTPGGVCFLCKDVMFSGDTLFLDDIGRCDFPGGSYSVMKQSLAKLVALDGDYTVYPGHGDSTTLEHERQYNTYINE